MSGRKRTLPTFKKKSWLAGPVSKGSPCNNTVFVDCPTITTAATSNTTPQGDPFLPIRPSVEEKLPVPHTNPLPVMSFSDFDADCGDNSNEMHKNDKLSQEIRNDPMWPWVSKLLAEAKANRDCKERRFITSLIDAANKKTKKTRKTPLEYWLIRSWHGADESH